MSTTTVLVTDMTLYLLLGNYKPINVIDATSDEAFRSLFILTHDDHSFVKKFGKF